MTQHSPDNVETDDEILSRGRTRPNLFVEIDREDVSDSDLERPLAKNLAKELESELFGDSDNEEENDYWGLPKPKKMERSKPVANSLANLINTACTSQCDTEDIASKYKVPENVNSCPPMVNHEIWKVLEKRAHSNDRAISDIQTLLAAGM